MRRYLKEHGIARFIEAQAFLWSYDSATHPPPPSHFPVNKLDLRRKGRLRKRDNLPTEKGGGAEAAGVEPNHTTATKLVHYKSLHPL
jgi:hypothetical protein